MKVLKLSSNEDVNLNRIASLSKALKEDASYMTSILEMLVDYCKEFETDAYHYLPKLEDKLEEALHRSEQWNEEVEGDMSAELKGAARDEHKP